MSEESKPPALDDDHECQSGTKWCARCVERYRKVGIPEHTINWLQLDKLQRIETVMF